MKTTNHPSKSVSEISVLHMTVKLSLLASFFVGSTFGLLLAVKEVVHLLN